ncbi:MAPK/MAK/MRK overlapping kinase-like [Venturia canescens]|uniref:MAPK/MAK/MRK overlapping kinase-like n=1 Tax=Venturia canescens TaxID=32260 RepID=UPI001C9C6FC8|nr:MAPK/MAK/MRK overlapping kinase-like [Venturia canescens]
MEEEFEGKILGRRAALDNGVVRETQGLKYLKQQQEVTAIDEISATGNIISEYKVLEKIGEGSFSEVLKCQDRQNGTLYAAKRLKRVYQNLNEMMESPEVIAMRKISRHPNILSMIESHYDAMSGKVTLVFELMDMSLYDLIRGKKGRTLTEKRIKVYLYQLLKGLEHLHKHGLFHRDVKPENILVKGDTVKLADLGSIRGIYSRPPYTEYISTRWYRSPECLLTTGFYGPKMDVWAIGCVYYELLTSKPLFPGSNEVDQLSKIHTILGTPHARLVAKFRRHSKARNCEYFFPNKGGTGLSNLLPHVSENGRDLLKLTLVYDPENRSNVRRLLDHRYFHDLRERDFSPATRHTSTLIVPNSSRESAQWSRNPVFLSYITSEKRRKSKVSRGHPSKKSYEEDANNKVPRVVASSPSNRCDDGGVSGVAAASTGNQVPKQQRRLNHVCRNNNGRAAAVNNSTTKIQPSNRLPPILDARSKLNLSRESSKSLNFPTRVAPLVSPKSHRSRMMSFRAEGEIPFSNSFLPQIALKSSSKSFHRFPVTGSIVSAPNENLNPTSFPSNVRLLRHSKLATINEQQQQTLNYLVAQPAIILNKSPRSKSPAKKIPKHEISHHQRLNPGKKLKTYAAKASLKRDRLQIIHLHYTLSCR